MPYDQFAQFSRWAHDLRGKPKKHDVFPWNPQLMFCPRDGQYHQWGCACARKHPRLVPGALRDFYADNWKKQR